MKVKYQGMGGMKDGGPQGCCWHSPTGLEVEYDLHLHGFFGGEGLYQSPPMEG